MADLLISKISYGDKSYEVKDAYARTELGKIASDISGIQGTISALGHPFEYTVVTDASHTPNAVEGGLLEPTEENMYKLFLVGVAGASGVSVYDEWLVINTGSGLKWERIGSTSTELGDYLTNAATVAGIAFGSDNAITATDLKNALGVIDSEALKNVVFEGSTTLSHKGKNDRTDFESTGKVTADGQNAASAVSFGGSFGSASAVATDGSVTNSVPTAIDITKFNGGELPVLTLSNTGETLNIEFNQGALASLLAGFYTPGSASDVVLPTFTSVNNLVTSGTTATAAAQKFTGSEVEVTVKGAISQIEDHNVVIESQSKSK